MSKFVGIDEIRVKFQQVCVKDGRYIGLIFCTPGNEIDFGPVRIMGKNDDLEGAIVIANHCERVCALVIEFNKKESAWIDARRGSRMGIIEAIFGAGLKIAEQYDL